MGVWEMGLFNYHIYHTLPLYKLTKFVQNGDTQITPVNASSY